MWFPAARNIIFVAIKFMTKFAPTENEKKKKRNEEIFLVSREEL